MKVKDIIRKHGIAEQTFYRWKSKCGGMDVSDAKKLKSLEVENAKLKRLLADQMLSERRACGLLGVARSAVQYRSNRQFSDDKLRTRLKELAERYPR